MGLYDAYTELGSGALVLDEFAAVVEYEHELTPEGAVMAFRYKRTINPPTSRNWLIEIRDDATVLFRQEVTIDGAGAVTVETTIIGGVAIDPGDALDYLDEPDTVEYSIAGNVYHSAAYFMEVPRGAALVVMECDEVSTFTFYQRSVHFVPLVSDRMGTLFSVRPTEADPYAYEATRYMDGAWNAITGATPLGGDFPIGQMWRDGSGRFRVTALSDVWRILGSNDNWRLTGTGLSSTNTMFDDTYRFVNSCPMRVGGVAAIGMLGRAFGEPASTPNTIYFKRTTGSNIVARTWTAAVEVAEVPLFEPYSIWQIPENGRLIIANGREITTGVYGYYSDDNGATWAELEAS